MWVGKRMRFWKSDTTNAKIRNRTSPTVTSLITVGCLLSECRFESRGDPIDGIGLFDHRNVGEFRGRRIDVPAGREHKRDLLVAQALGNGPDAFSLQVHVEDRD